MNLPNFLTIARVLLALGFVCALSSPGLGGVILATVLFALAALTDFYDGYYAKKHDLVTNFGKIMDPIADKFLILSAFLMFVFMGLMPRWMFLAILLREGIVTGYRIAAITKGKFLAAEWAGKYKTVMQMSSVFLVLVFLMLRSVGVIADLPDAGHGIWREGIYIVMFFTVVLTLLSGISYLWNNRKIFLESRR